MFGRRRAREQPPTQVVPTGVHAQAVAVADPDSLNIIRERSLRNQLGHALQGQAGTIVGYDRGDPANSTMTVVRPLAIPSTAMAHVGFSDAQRFTDPQQIYDLGTTDPTANAYQAALLARITR
jgi:hypothetical protein